VRAGQVCRRSGADANPHGNRVHRWQRDVRGRRQGTKSFD